MSLPVYPIKFADKDLVGLVHQMYKKMFWDDCPDEIIAATMANMTLADDDHNSTHERRSNHKLYTPASLAAFLKLIKGRVQVDDWTATIEAILALIEKEPRREAHGDSEPIADYTPELRAWLHLFGVYTPLEWRVSNNNTHLMPRSERLWKLQTWRKIPPVMCVTVVVPQHKSVVVGRLERDNLAVGMPTFVECAISKPGDNKSCHGFAAVQVGYGWPQREVTRVRGSKSIFKTIMRLPNLEGKYHLMVSFMVPTSVLLQNPKTSMVKVQFRRTPNAADYGDVLGPGLTIHETPLHNYDQVVITRYPPRVRRIPTVYEFPRTLPPPDLSASATIAAGMDEIRSEITPLTASLQFTCPELNSCLAKGYTADYRLVSPCTYLITLSGSFTASTYDIKSMSESLFVHRDGPETCAWESSFPFSFPLLTDIFTADLITGPVSPDNNSIELLVSTIRPADTREIGASPSWIYPILLSPPLPHSASPVPYFSVTPISWSLPYLPCIDDLPVLDIQKLRSFRSSWRRFNLWLKNHTYTLSHWEHEHTETQPESLQEDLLSIGELSWLQWKKMVQGMMLGFTAVVGRRQNIFAVCPGGDQQRVVGMVFFVSCLRLDVANRCVLLDGAVLVRTAETAALIDGLEKELNDCADATAPAWTEAELDTSLKYFNTTREGIHLWKEILPAHVERCRTWEHDAERCEYLHRAGATGVIIPITDDTEDSSVLCGCGNGRVSGHDSIPKKVWERIKKHLVRVAISPPFGCPFVEEPYVPEIKKNVNNPTPRPPPPPPKLCAGTQTVKERMEESWTILFPFVRTPSTSTAPGRAVRLIQRDTRRRSVRVERARISEGKSGLGETRHVVEIVSL